MYECRNWEPEVTLVRAQVLSVRDTLRIGLNRTIELYSSMTFEEGLSDELRMRRELRPFAEDLFQDGRVRFLVVCGRDIFKSSDHPDDYYKGLLEIEAKTIELPIYRATDERRNRAASRAAELVGAGFMA